MSLTYIRNSGAATYRDPEKVQDPWRYVWILPTFPASFPFTYPQISSGPATKNHLSNFPNAPSSFIVPYELSL